MSDYQAVQDGLQALLDLQRPLIERLGYYENTTEVMSRYGMGLIIEVAEFLNECPWKSWTIKESDATRMKEEFADLLSFIGAWIALLDLIGISPNDLAKAYQEKRMENEHRFVAQEF
jgi:dimeric dUTPase (all-alpha-NTP-PPase superfamily)